MQTFRTARGRSQPLGATALAEGVNFALLCRHGTAVSLLVFALEGDDLLGEVPLDPSATALSDGAVWGRSSETNGVPTPATGTVRRSLFFRRAFNWREDAPPL